MCWCICKSLWIPLKCFSSTAKTSITPIQFCSQVFYFYFSEYIPTLWLHSTMEVAEGNSPCSMSDGVGGKEETDKWGGGIRGNGKKGGGWKWKRRDTDRDLFWIHLLLYSLTRETFHSPEPPLMRWLWESLSVHWMVSLPHSSCKNTTTSVSLSLPLPLLLDMWLARFVIIQKHRKKPQCRVSAFLSTINQTEYRISFTSSASVLAASLRLYFFAPLSQFQEQGSLTLLTAEFLLFTAQDDLQLSSVAEPGKEICYSHLKRHPKR